jgi:type II secretory pathway pseudopilin PulG
MSAGRREQGFTLAAALIAVALLGAGMAAYGEIASHAAQREKERELLFVGNQFRQAIGTYYERTPGAVKKFPQKLEELLKDARYPTPQRHLRRIYPDPMTGKAEWGVIQAPGGGIMGVYSLSQARPVKSGNFAFRDASLAGAARYADWQFSYVPATPFGATAPAAVTPAQAGAAQAAVTPAQAGAAQAAVTPAQAGASDRLEAQPR